VRTRATWRPRRTKKKNQVKGLGDVEKLFAEEAARAAKNEQRAVAAVALNPFGTGTRVQPADDIVVRQVAGSTAGASSGDFHLYRNQRRTELERLAGMEAEAEQVRPVRPRVRASRASHSRSAADQSLRSAGGSSSKRSRPRLPRRLPNASVPSSANAAKRNAPPTPTTTTTAAAAAAAVVVMMMVMVMVMVVVATMVQSNRQPQILIQSERVGSLSR